MRTHPARGDALDTPTITVISGPTGRAAAAVRRAHPQRDDPSRRLGPEGPPSARRRAVATTSRQAGARRRSARGGPTRGTRTTDRPSRRSQRHTGDDDAVDQPVGTETRPTVNIGEEPCATCPREADSTHTGQDPRDARDVPYTRPHRTQRMGRRVCDRRESTTLRTPVRRTPSSQPAVVPPSRRRTGEHHDGQSAGRCDNDPGKGKNHA